YSIARDVWGGEQTGYAIVGGDIHAVLWHGTAASWIDLNPVGSPESFAYAVHAGRQVGSAKVGGVDHACLWTGTAESWVDLHPFVPPEYWSSEADGICRDDEF